MYAAMWGTIMNETIGCYPGLKGSNADILLRKIMPGVENVRYFDLDFEVFYAIEDGDIAGGLVPYETALGRRMVDYLFAETENVKINKKILSPVYFSLAGFGQQDNLGLIKHVSSKEEALTQSRIYLRKNMPRAKKIKTDSTTSSLPEIQQSKDTSHAVICSAESARIYGVPVIKENIAKGKTTFLYLSREDAEFLENTPYETYLLYGLPDSGEIGALENSMRDIFTKNDVNLTSITSVPKDNGNGEEYYFAVLVKGHREQSNVASAIDASKDIVTYLRVGGSCEIIRM